MCIRDSPNSPHGLCRRKATLNCKCKQSLSGVTVTLLPRAQTVPLRTVPSFHLKEKHKASKGGVVASQGTGDGEEWGSLVFLCVPVVVVGGGRGGQICVEAEVAMGRAQNYANCS